MSFAFIYSQSNSVLFFFNPVALHWHSSYPTTVYLNKQNLERLSIRQLVSFCLSFQDPRQSPLGFDSSIQDYRMPENLQRQINGIKLFSTLKINSVRHFFY